MLHQMHVELMETKKRCDERRANKKPFIYKEIDFPSISGDRSREKRITAGNIGVSKLFETLQSFRLQLKMVTSQVMLPVSNIISNWPKIYL